MGGILALASDRNLKIWTELRVQVYLERCGGNKECDKKIYDQAKWLHNFTKGSPMADSI